MMDSDIQGDSEKKMVGQEGEREVMSVNEVGQVNSRKSNKWWIVGGGLVFLLLLGVGVYWWQVRLERSEGGRGEVEEKVVEEEEGGEVSSVEGGKQWVNCSSVRDVVREDGRIYAACLGGVWVVDEVTGKVKDQISMADGLGSGVLNSLVKKGDALYVGTQDGFTKFNLRSRQAEKISVEKGLSNGGNVILSEDGSDLWVGTFDGINRYDTNTGELVVYREEISQGAPKVNIREILVTQKGIYALTVSSAKTAGGIARYDKVSKSWEVVGATGFGKDMRVDLTGLSKVGSKVVVSDRDSFWIAEDKKGLEWEERLEVFNKLKELVGDDYPNPSLLGEREGGVLMVVDSWLIEWDLDTDEVEIVYPERHQGGVSSVVSQGQVVTSRQGRIWLKSDLNESSWMKWLTVGDWQEGRIDRSLRPEMVREVLAVINDQVILMGKESMWIYDYGKEAFKSMSVLSSVHEAMGGLMVFEPILGSSEVFIYLQSCGMGCGRPEVLIYNYKDETYKPIELPETVVKNISGDRSGDWGYKPLFFSRYDEKESVMRFVYGEDNEAVFNVEDGVWQTQAGWEDRNKTSVGKCNKWFEWTESQGFTRKSCGESIKNEEYVWESEWLAKENMGRLWQESRDGGDRKELMPKLAAVKYSSFPSDDNDRYEVNQLSYAQDRLWVGTDRGLSIYDPDSEEWKLLSVEDGLVSNEVVSFVVQEEVVWVVSNWGGLAVVEWR